MLKFYPLILALCGQPKENLCYMEALHCDTRSKQEVVCVADVVIKKPGKKIVRKKLKAKIK